MMTDFDAIFGFWRAKTCEWKNPPESDDAPECGKPPLPGTAYCQECHDKAYQKPVKKTKRRANGQN